MIDPCTYCASEIPWKDIYHSREWDCIECTPSLYCKWCDPHDDECEMRVELDA